MSDQVRIGVIGGSGLYQMEELEVVAERRLTTPFGDPSDDYIVGQVGENRVAFLPRHGRGHRILPSELNFRANLWGLKSLGVEWVVSVSAVGSLQFQYRPTDIVVPLQFYDRTRHRADTFFGKGLVAHVSLAEPICPKLAGILVEGARAAGAKVHEGGTYVNMEGPQFSTRAESNVYRSWGMDIIGMTNLQEAKLAREAEMSYATLAMVTDYDCWHEEEEDVTGVAVMQVVEQNVATAQRALVEILARIPADEDSPYRGVLGQSMVTDLELVPEETLEALRPLLNPYLDD